MGHEREHGGDSLHDPGGVRRATKTRMNCPHEDFLAQVNVNRLSDSGRFSADVSICCAVCKEPFRFLGLPAGTDLNGATVSVDGTEARLAIGTAETVANIMDGNCPVGFTVRRQ